MSNGSQIQRRGPEGLATSGSFANAKEASDALRAAAEHFNFVSPATSVGVLPEGVEIVLSHVFVDTTLVKKLVKYKGNEVERTVSASGDIFPVDGGNWGLSKHVLNRIWAAAGGKWIFSGRVDDRRDPLYCAWSVEGEYRAFDGQQMTVPGNKQMDLRARSKQLAGKSPAQIDQMSAGIVEHAETKAKLRAIRDAFGIKSSYTLEELKKPFVAARVIFTGRSSDPETQREFNRMIATSFLGSSRALYGGGGQQPRQLAAPAHSVRTLDDDSGDYNLDTDDGYGDDRGGPPPQQQREPSATPPASNARPAAPRTSGGANRPTVGASGLTMPFGRSSGVALEEAPQEDVEWMARTIKRKLDNGEARYPEKDAQFLGALEDELARRDQEQGEKY